MPSSFVTAIAAGGQLRHVMALLVLVLATVTLAPSEARAARTFPQWGTLDPGRYAVGFRVIEQYDRSRTHIPYKDYSGREIGAEHGRPIQIRMWYPTTAEPVDTMPYAEYVHLRASAMTFAPLTDHERAAEERAFASRMHRRGSFSDAEIEDILRTPTAAVRDAAPASGPFPVVLVPPQGSLHSWVLYEYLASHGYVVAIVPSHGPRSRNVPQSVSNAYETAVRDMEFAFGALHDVPEADVSRLGLLAFSSVSLHSILFQARQMAASAIVALEGWEGFLRGTRILAERPGYDPAAIRVPYMLIKKSKEERNPDYASDREFFEAITSSDRYRVIIEEADHQDFITLAYIANRQDEKRPIHDAACRITQAFFDAHLAGKPDGFAGFVASPHVAGLAAGQVKVEHLEAAPAFPTHGELVRMLEDGGDTLAEVRGLLESRGNAADWMPEAMLIDLGYSLLREGHPHTAVDVFELAIQAYPTSANAHDSLSDAHEAAGERAQAEQAAEQALALLDADTSLDDTRRERLRTALTEKLVGWQSSGSQE